MHKLSIPFLAIVLMALNLTLSAQVVLQDLNGFRLGQARTATHRELGDPDQQGEMDENVSYEAFLLNEEPALYMVFQYQKNDPDLIWSIQITGADEKHDPAFKGLTLGMSPAIVEKQLGKPTRKINVDEHGTRWEFDNQNVSVEISPQNKLSSIRIVEERDKEPDLKNFPKFDGLVKKLPAATNAELAELVAPDMELYEGGKIRSFEWSLANEIKLDRSGVFGAMRRLSKELSTVDIRKTDQYEENMRFRYGRDPLHVIKLPKLTGVTEIAFRWNGDRWLIWEFGTGKAGPDPQAWKSIYKPGTLKDLVSIRIPELIKDPNVEMKKADGKPLASFSYNSHTTSTTVIFTGESRKTPESTLTLISLWLETIGKPKDLVKLFEFEYKFIENGIEYWLPLQNPLPERLAKEAKKGDSIVIYLSWIGIEFENDRPELLAIVNEFSSIGK